ncbi:MAG: phosphodiesterase [Acidobacteria bacterium]|nr:phosphodiesterase [Acidobacteriota bacterium]
MIQLGQHGPPTHTIAHISDTHYLGGRRALYGSVDTDRMLAMALEQLERSGTNPDAIVITGDLADLGEPDAYHRLKAEIEPVAARMGSTIIWVMGNHDERAPFAAILLGEEETDSPQDRVYDIDGLRIIALDSTVPGYHHGEFSPAQLSWLEEVLAVPATHGTLLALHHPPTPTPVEIMAIIELQDQPAFAEVIRGTDVRGILAGHLHYSTFGSFAGVPVSVASATCYTIDSSAEPDTLLGVDGGQSINLVSVYPDSVVHAIVPVGSFPQVAGFPATMLERLAALTPHERREAFSRKTSTVGAADAESSAARQPR